MSTKAIMVFRSGALVKQALCLSDPLSSTSSSNLLLQTSLQRLLA